MFSLLITTIAIALVVLLTLAAIYYGGNSLNKGGPRADAATIITQAQQVIGASQLYKVHKAQWPASAEELVQTSHLKSIPSAPRNSNPWTQVKTRTPQFWLLRTVSEDICREVNRQTRGDDGIYKAARRDLLIQCFGQNEKYTVLVYGTDDGSDDIGTTVPAAGGIPQLIVDNSGGGWAVPPEAGYLEVGTIIPSHVTPAAGQTVTIGGKGFADGTTVTIGGVPAQVTATSPTSLTVQTPTLALGDQPVSVSVPGFGTQKASRPLKVVSTLPTAKFVIRDNTTNAELSTVMFPTTTVPQVSAPITVKIENTGELDLTTGAAPITVTAPFKLESSTCPANGTLEVGKACTATLTFSPTIAGSFNNTSFWTFSSNAKQTLPALAGTANPEGTMTGKITQVAGSNFPDKFTVGADSETLYYVKDRSVFAYKGGTVNEIPISVPNTCPNTDTGASKPPIPSFYDVAFDHMTGKLFVSSRCDNGAAQFHPLQLIHVNLNSRTGVILTTQTSSTRTFGQQELLLAGNLHGHVLMTTYHGSLGARYDGSVGGGTDYTGSVYPVVVSDIATTGSSARITGHYTGYDSGKFCSNVQQNYGLGSCISSPWQSNMQPPMVIGKSGSMFVIRNLTGDDALMEYRVDFGADRKVRAVTWLRTIVTDSRLQHRSNGKLVAAPDGSLYYYTWAIGVFRIQ